MFSDEKAPGCAGIVRISPDSELSAIDNDGFSNEKIVRVKSGNAPQSFRIGKMSEDAPSFHKPCLMVRKAISLSSL